MAALHGLPGSAQPPGVATNTPAGEAEARGGAFDDPHGRDVAIGLSGDERIEAQRLRAELEAELGISAARTSAAKV